MKKDPLQSLYWRDEILQAMYWMKGEGIASEVSVADLLPLLAIDGAIIAAQLENLLELGDVEAIEVGEQKKYRLTSSGLQIAGQRFYDEFKDHLSRDVHGGECKEDCECHDEESRAACEAERHA